MAGPSRITRSDRRRLSGLSAPLVQDQELRRFFEAISEHVRMYEGDRNAPKERFVTIDDLERAGVIATKVRGGFAEITEQTTAATDAASTSGVTEPSATVGTFAALTDTDVPAAVANDFLYFTGAKWKNFNFNTQSRSIQAPWTFAEETSFLSDVELRSGVSLLLRDITGSDSVEGYHDGVDFNFDFTNTDAWNLTGLSSIQAGSTDADFDAITATSYGGIAEANLLDLSDDETVTGNWVFSGTLDIPEAAVTDHEGAIHHGALTGLGDNDHPQYARIAANESISGSWTFSNISITDDDVSFNGGVGTGLRIITSAAGLNIFRSIGVGTGSDFLYEESSDRWQFDTDLYVVGEVIGARTSAAGRYAFRAESATPGYFWHETDAGANEGEWRLFASGGAMFWQTRSDDDGAGNTFLQISRSGNVVALIDISATLVDVSNDLDVGGDLDSAGNFYTGGSAYIGEQSAAAADTAGFGQLWVRDSDGALMFTNAAGSDFIVDLTAA